MTALLPRLSAASVGAAVAVAVLGAPTAALAAGPGEPGAAGTARAAQQGPAALPTQAAAARSAASSTSPAPAAAGSAGGAAAGRSTAQVAATRTDGAAGSAGRSTGERGAATRSATAHRPAARPAARPAQPAKPAQAGKPARPAKAAKPAPPVKPAKPAKPAQAEPATPQGTFESAGTSAPSAQQGGDPRGNNGTFKVDGPVLDTSHGNEPQVDCAFRLNFFGYDAGQLATIVFTPIAPTPGASTTVSGRQLISSDAARGGLYNGSYPVTGTWTAADLGVDPTVRQHVKVSVESFNADGSDVPGGAKHKVFWLHPCAAAAPLAMSPSVFAPAVLPETPAFETRSIAAAPAAQPAVAPAAAPVMGPQAQVMGAAVTAVTGQNATAATVVAAPARTLGAATAATAATAASHPAAAARHAAGPATLPFTGSPQLLALLVGGLIALLGGTALVAAARTGA